MTPYNTSPKIDKFGYLPGALKALEHDPGVFVQHQRLVELIHCPKPEIVELDYARLRERLDHNQIWRGFAKPTMDAPPAFYAQFLRRKDWPGIKTLTGFTAVPLLRPDGTVLDEGGYDEASGFHYEPAGTFDIPAAPTHGDAARAREFLTKRIRRLPFETEAHRSAFLAALLTPFARAAFTGPVPLFQLDAPSDRTPMQLANYVSLLVNGDDMLLMEKPASERSFRSQLARTQLRGEHMVLVTGADTWRSANPLRTALFSLEWADGAARKSDPRPITWFAATANGALTQSVAELVLPIRLDATEDLVTRECWAPPPEFRAGLIRDRNQLVSAALTILRAYEVAGRPAQIALWSGFEEWTKLVASSLVWAGAANPLDARTSAFEAVNDDTPELRPLFEILHTLQGDRPGLTAQQIIDHAKEDDDLRQLLASLLASGWQKPRTVGELLRKHVKLRLDQLRLEKAGKNRLKAVLWSIRRRAESAESLHADDDTLAPVERPAPLTTPADEEPAAPPAPEPAPPEKKEKKPIPKHWPAIFHQRRAEEDAAEAAALAAQQAEAAKLAEVAKEQPTPESTNAAAESSLSAIVSERSEVADEPVASPAVEIAALPPTAANDDRPAESAESLHAAPPPCRPLTQEEAIARDRAEQEARIAKLPVWHPALHPDHPEHWNWKFTFRFVDIPTWRARRLAQFLNAA